MIIFPEIICYQSTKQSIQETKQSAGTQIYVAGWLYIGNGFPGKLKKLFLLLMLMLNLNVIQQSKFYTTRSQNRFI